VKFQLHAFSPLHVGHLEQIDLRHRACDVQKRVDPAETIETRPDERFCRFGLGQIKITNKRLRT
jgi:hypothetical protein